MIVRASDRNPPLLRAFHRVAAVAAALGLLVAVPARADEEKKEGVPLLGLGVGLGIGNAYSGGTPATPPVSLYATLNLGEHLRIEPNFGYWYIGKGQTASTVISGVVDPGGGYAVQAGVGGFYVLRPLQPLGLYGGARLGLVFSGSSATLVDRTTVSASETDLYLSPTFGFEWSIVRALSLGGEAQVVFRWYFDPTVTGSGGASTTVTRSKFGTGIEALIFVRVYVL
jgi:hypothetical protein